MFSNTARTWGFGQNFLETFQIRDVTGGNNPFNIDTSGKVGIGTTSPSYPLTVVGNTSGISIWSDGNVSASGYITRTSVWDPNDGSALSWIKDASELKSNQVVNHGAFLPSEPIRMSIAHKIGEEVTEEGTVGIYESRVEEGVLLDEMIAKHEQALYELKTELCKHDVSYAWC